VVADDSKSYPYLALARRLGVPYGRVLLTADSCDGRKISEWSRLETEKLTEEEKWEVFCLWKSLETSGRKNYFVGCRMVTEWPRDGEVDQRGEVGDIVVDGGSKR